MSNTLKAAFGHTDIGQRRQSNQDSYLCLHLRAAGQTGYLLAVADGMGGHAGGDVASEMAITALRERVTRVPARGESAPDSLRELLVDGFATANARIVARAEENPELHGMGTTLVAALAVGPRLCLANVGDSRAYALSAEGVRQLTTDHTWETREQQRGELDADEIASSPYAGMLTRSVGTAPDVQVDSFDVSLRPGEYLLLCSDGLYRELDTTTMRDVVLAADDVEAACEELLRRANDAGAQDNVTCIIAGPSGDAAPDTSATSQTQPFTVLGTVRDS